MTRFLVRTFALSMGLCWVSSNVVLSNEKALGLGIATPPHVTFPTHQTTQYVGETLNVALKCEATGNPPPRYQWRWNGNPILEKHQVHPETGILEIEDFSWDKEGYFQCLAFNDHGVSLSQVTELRTRVNPRFGNDQRPGKEKTVEAGQGVTMDCFDKPVFRPMGHWYWYHVENEHQTQIHVSSYDRMDMDVNGTLYITNADEADEADTYACAVSSDLVDGVSVAKTPYWKLTVTDRSVQQTKPVVLGHTGYVTADSGNEATLECFFGGQPKPNITWYKDFRKHRIVNETGNRFYISAKNHKLKIKHLTDDDEGKYICNATNIRGSTIAETYLNVTSRPQFEKTGPEIIVTPVGGNATFTCRAKGSVDEVAPSPPVWTINGTALPANESKFSLSADGTQLTVVSLTKQDLMCVQCNVTNSRGYAFGDSYLIVIDPLTLISHPNHIMEIYSNTSTVNMTVVAKADPCCQAHFSWYLNDSMLLKTTVRQPPYSYQLGHNRATLSIDLDGKTETEKRKLMGEYRCEVYHSAYSYIKQVSVVVRMKEPPVIDKVTEAKVNYWWIGVVGGVAVLIIALVIIGLMIRFNYPRQEYLLAKEEMKHKLNPEQDLLDRSFEEI